MDVCPNFSEEKYSRGSYSSNKPRPEDCKHYDIVLDKCGFAVLSLFLLFPLFLTDYGECNLSKCGSCSKFSRY